MSLPSALLLSRYRAFAGEEVLPLRPLTLLYGRNNAGKSALVRLVPLLAASIADGVQSAILFPPGLRRDANRDPSFTDLAWQGEAGDHSFALGLRWDDGIVREVRYLIDGSAGQPPYVKELTLRGEHGQLLWDGIGPPQGPLRPALGSPSGAVRCAGLVPAATTVPAVQELAARLRALRGRLCWLDGIRARPRSGVKRTGNVPALLSPSGDNSSEFLVERPQLVPEVARFYRQLHPARDLELKDELDLGHRLRLNHMNRASFQIDLIDTGEGMIQVLSVLLGAALAAHSAQPGLLAVEEPESHLHPDAQRALADYVCRLAAQPNPPTLILEIHSRVFLLGVQLAVANGLPPERVGISWIDQDAQGRSTITQVGLERSGHLGAGWPVTALTEDLKLAGDLARLDLQRPAQRG